MRLRQVLVAVSPAGAGAVKAVNASAARSEARGMILEAVIGFGSLGGCVRRSMGRRCCPAVD